MPSFGGFYIPSTVWEAWVLAQGPPPWPQWDASIAQDMIFKKLETKGLTRHFGVQMISSLRTDIHNHRDAIMVYRRKTKKLGVYLPPREGNVADCEARRILELFIGLKVSEWQTISYNWNSTANVVYSKIVKPHQ